MWRRFAVLALVACVVLAGCGGPATENETTESDSDGTRAVALPPNETVAEPATTRTTTAETTPATTAEAVYPSF